MSEPAAPEFSPLDSSHAPSSSAASAPASAGGLEPAPHPLPDPSSQPAPSSTQVQTGAHDVVEVVVIGGGAAGCMATLRSVLNQRQTVLFTGDLDAKRRSRAQWVHDVDNLPTFSGQRFPIAHSLQTTLDWIAARPELARCLRVVKASVDGLENLAVQAQGPESSRFAVSWTERSRRNPVGTAFRLQSRTLILATGVMDIQPHIGGSIEPVFAYANAGEILYCVTSDGHRVLGKPSGVLGHTDLAAEVALTLHERYHPPLLRVFTHLQAPAFSPELSAQLAQYGIPVIEGEILGFEGKARKEGLQAVLLKDARVEVQRLFVALGMMTWSDLASALGAHCSPDGYVLTDAHGQTSIPGFYAVGDVQHGLRRQIYTAWESAVAAVEHLDARLRAERRTATSAQR